MIPFSSAFQSVIKRSVRTLCSSLKLIMMETVRAILSVYCVACHVRMMSINTLKYTFVSLTPIQTAAQVRRMKVAEIWDQWTLNFSVSKLLALAVGFIDDAAAQRDALIAKAKVTYLDEDGDEVYISSDEEVKDAFLQVLALLPIRKPFLVSVTFPKTVKVVENAENKTTTTAVGGMPRRIQVRKVEPAKKTFSASNIEEQSPPVLRCIKKLNHALLRITPQSFENKFFVHARHTCDGCLKSPIIGTRYHATKIPDFDLCESCIKKYEGDDLDFVPEIQGKLVYSCSVCLMFCSRCFGNQV